MICLLGSVGGGGTNVACLLGSMGRGGTKVACLFGSIVVVVQMLLLLLPSTEIHPYHSPAPHLAS